MHHGTVRLRQLGIIFTLFVHAFSTLRAEAQSHGTKPLAFFRVG